jgi:hypothetical protein
MSLILSDLGPIFREKEIRRGGKKSADAAVF